MKVFVISLKKDNLRREALKKRFKSYDSFCVIDAVDAREFSPNEYYSHILPPFVKYAKLLTPAEVGCSLSHVRAYEKFLQSGEKYALIFEDDVIGDDEGIKKVAKICENLDENSVLICGCQDGLDGRFSAFGKRFGDELFMVSKHSYCSIYRAAAYVITRQSAKKLLRLHKQAICIADLWGYLLKEGQMKMYFADIFAHPLDLSNSNLQSQRADRMRFLKVGIVDYLHSFRYILLTRIQKYLFGYEKIFKR